MTAITMTAITMTAITGLILIVDDTPTNLDVISEVLSQTGFDVAIATSGERALQQVERRVPDLILLDVMMPGIDGFETCRRLKANAATSKIPIIFMTALSDADSKVQALELGAVDYITKPFYEKEVLARVRTHLQLHRLTQALEQQVVSKVAELQASQLQMIQSEKMSALGQLVAGVAHEINNPVGFIQGNLLHVEAYVKDLLQLIDCYQRHYPQPVAEVQQQIAEIDLNYLQADLPKVIESIQTGVERIRDISTSLRTFSRADYDYPVSFNLHEGIESAILILKHRLKANELRPKIEIVRQFGQLPQVECYAGQLSQVFINILGNAIDAIEELHQEQINEEIEVEPGCITIQTELIEMQAVIRIQDNGIGMSEIVKQRIFDNLFTTKRVGKGTGLGLAIVHQIMVEKHGGAIEVSSMPKQGSEFVLTLPISYHGFSADREP